MQQKQTTVVLMPPSGQKEITETFILNGYVESMVVVTRGNENKLQVGEATLPLIFLSLEDNNRGEIIPMAHIEIYKQKGGGYKESLKPLEIMAKNQTFKMTLKTDRASNNTVANDIQVFVYFFYGNEPLQKIQPARIAAQPVKTNAQPVRRPQPNFTR